jgi:hypothetical protein
MKYLHKYIRHFSRPFILASIGAVCGFAYYYFIGCSHGHCVISSNPTISTLYGSAIGLVLGTSSRRVQGSSSNQKERE